MPSYEGITDGCRGSILGFSVNGITAVYGYECDCGKGMWAMGELSEVIRGVIGSGGRLGVEAYRDSGRDYLRVRYTCVHDCKMDRWVDFRDGGIELSEVVMKVIVQMTKETIKQKGQFCGFCYEKVVEG